MRVLASTLFALLMIAFSGCGGSSTSTHGQRVDMDER